MHMGGLAITRGKHSDLQRWSHAFLVTLLRVIAYPYHVKGIVVATARSGV